MNPQILLHCHSLRYFHGKEGKALGPAVSVRVYQLRPVDRRRYNLTAIEAIHSRVLVMLE